ncbi:MAG: pyridoxamine 5'-phosphate oxidase family protein [Candidatus Abyssobacteria bacterium SURF_17]|uniref:Pyridoxamine 5'-phosphate oxidase family protein n=1 Tax=Candidatus Abyssobacteria bacterium SURF_17 TaxID=2093361 RepID=A0A419ERH3_9BACT|nr:MAG: pyridoxamine 5'-phosphate oxidase family protein [Candidatus Abyssubacteria bacterium SURF_17]
MKELFASQKLAVLATHNEKQSYASLVAFASTADLKQLLFATTRATRKYANLAANPNVALLIDNRSNRETDFHKAVAATATGKTTEVGTRERTRLLKLYLGKHPHLREFVSSPNCALLKVKVDSYFVVNRFQNVMELRPR